MQLVAPDLEGWYDPVACADDADAWLAWLGAHLPWTTHHIRMFGRSVASPRLSCWIADHETTYRYSGITLIGAGWPSELEPLRAIVEERCGPFNGVLANRYRDGSDSMGWHADDEPELGPQPTIAAVTFGAPRRFLLKHKQRTDVDRITLELGHGSLLLLSGPTQQHWVHSVPKTKRAIGERINLTFRTIVN